MKCYLDTSFLIPIVIDEFWSTPARAWWRDSSADCVASDFAAIEFAAVVSRLTRIGSINVIKAEAILLDFDDLQRICVPYQPDRADYVQAQKIARDFSTKLLAPDALHLASALNLDATLVTYDERLNEAARAYGVRTVSPKV